MKIPGATASHQIITDDCRSARGDGGAFDEAVRRLREMYDSVCEGRRGQAGVKLHLVLSVERPR